MESSNHEENHDSNRKRSTSSVSDDEQAKRVKYSASSGSHISAPVLSHNDVQRDVNITNYYYGTSFPLANVEARANSSDQSDIIHDYRKLIHSEYATVQEYNSLPGEDVKLSDRYSELLIVQRHREQNEREKEIRSRGVSFQQVLSSRASEAYSSTSVEELFNPNSHGPSPKAVILQGNPGSGKSFTVKKIMCDWASGTLYMDRFDLVVHLRCKELNHVVGNKSVVELVNHSPKYLSLISRMLHDSPDRVLFLIDGFDELKLPLEEAATFPPSDLVTPATLHGTLSALLRGRILPKCFLLVTTRSTALDRLSRLLRGPQRFTEILGFSEKGVEMYFQRFFNDKRLSQVAYDSVRANETLFTACFIPVICWIVCTVFREQFKDGVDMTRGLETTTSIFVYFVVTLLDHHCQGLNVSPPDMLKNLSELAEKETLKQHVLFDEKSVSEAVSDPTSVPFLCKFPLKRKIRVQMMFSFMHLSFQEFFTALCYTLMDMDQAHRKVNDLIGSVQGDQQDMKNTHLLPVIQFLLGLSNEEVRSSLTETLPLSVSPIRGLLEEWLLKVIKEMRDSRWGDDMKLFILHSLYELNEEHFVRKAMETWERVDLAFIPLKKTDCWVLRYCLLCCERIKSLCLNCCNISAQKLQMLAPGLQNCEELELHVHNLSDADTTDLTSALGEGKILDLRLDHSSLSCESLQLVLHALTKQKQVRTVDLQVSTIMSDAIAKIVDFIQTTSIGDQVCIELNEPTEESGDSLCSFLSVEKDSESLILSVKHRRTPDGTFDHSEIFNPQIKPSLSEISITMAQMKTPSINWIDYFNKFFALKDLTESLGFDEHVATLLSTLHSVPCLGSMFLVVSCVTERLAAGILSLINACPSLKTVQLYAGLIGNGMLSDEAVRLLHESQMVPEFTLVVIGKRCHKATERCNNNSQWSLSCNHRVQLQFQSGSFTEEDLEISYLEEDFSHGAT
ncbi:NACHT, LRR and PYD domains-containing protein 3-like isoform X2 [Denticeps clupeoides]|uniref:NACHT domain-containing protein n=1 Tax=Denticeps clupeoides TaxID=299321 RepID=A0AAY4BKG2_9TELE|nr:NACHT, LRR and PYD domains-containing protein 3-like isoform X2 [Denticeps clupeoides]